jgi:ATP-dependent RNA circularization protein (DNA/RNA ligase family)
MKYFKINSLWKRQGWYFDEEEKKSPNCQQGKQSFIVGDYACPEFGNVKTWNVTEKIDGTNIRVMYNQGALSFGGRTDEAIIQPHLLKYLQDTFTPELIHLAFPTADVHDITLYGEGYGPKIQAGGGNYVQDVGFVLFDVLSGKFWFDRSMVKETAAKLNIPVVPDLGRMTEDQIVDLVKSKPLSQCSWKPQTMEGVVCRADPEVYFQHGAVVTFKLKCKEF